MNRIFSKYFTVVALGVLVAGGCARKDLVKKEELTAPAATVLNAEAPAGTDSSDQAAIEEQAVKETPVGGRPADNAGKSLAQELALENIFFDFDSYLLSPAARDALTRNAREIKGKSGVKFRIEGHCDERGSDEYNLALGEKRGKAALEYLVTLGVPAERLSVISYGKEKPAVPGSDEASWAKNRRDEFVVTAQ
ncbi:peptidoglycan-associated lipoprotein Pal [Geobacter sp. DSM 9736]|uniref:peptidoglycan-associated lipoprotein Pal n=1 Tax=Geobacter sp. DSM 9736 TaxID=1277350 RepID=UPI000B50B3DD|nr:peptidoglycan-associated lipoprotein Pal [Geobacter sp. DSM 9736]SNB46911.1 peptidoglycan-associated lipoprotein [Geobacter sp. DSM 9736]